MRKPIVVVGSLNVDLAVTTDRFVVPGETLPGREFRMVAGGKGANQAAAAARLGYPTRLCGRVGHDSFAERVLAALRAAGVDVADVEAVPGSTGVALITTVKSGQNSIVVVPGANGEVGRNDVDRWRAAIQGAALVLSQLEIPMDAVERLGELCAEVGVPLMLDPAPAHRLSPDLLRTVTWLTPNETEVSTLTGRHIATAQAAELREVSEGFLAAGVGGVVLKLGARGAYIAHVGGHLWLEPYAVACLDTTAAGDAFNGAFAVGLQRLGDPFAAARFACAAAAISTTVRGAVPSMPTEPEVQDLMGRYGVRVS